MWDKSTGPGRGPRGVAVLCMVVALAGVLWTAPAIMADSPEERMSSEELLKRIDEVAMQPITEAQTAELDRLMGLYEKALEREAAQDEVKPAEEEPESPKTPIRPRRTPRPRVKPTPQPVNSADRQSGIRRGATGRNTQPPTTVDDKPQPPRRGTRIPGADDSPAPNAGPAEEGVAVETQLNLLAENALKPYDQRKYSFSMRDVSYADLVEAFSRMSGLPVIGEAPQGTTNFVSSGVMDFKEALSNVQMLLFKHPEQYWIQLRDKSYLEINQVRDGVRPLPLERIFPTLAEYKDANLDENELALLLYTPQSGSIADLDPLRDFMPDYVRIAQYSTENALTVFGLVRDINKYLNLIDKLNRGTEDPRTVEIISVEYVLPSAAVEMLKQLMSGFDVQPGARASVRRPGEPSIAAAEAYGITTIPNDERGTILVQAMPAKITEIKKFLEFIDVEMPMSAYEPEIVPIIHASAGDILNLVKSVMGAADAGTGASPAPPRRPARRSSRKGEAAGVAATGATAGTDTLTMIEWTPTNSIILMGEEEDVTEAKALIARFDVPDEMEMKLVEVIHADAAELAPLVTQLLQSVPGAPSSLNCTADPTGAAIILAGPANAVARAEELIARLDTEPGGPAEEIHTIQLLNAKPSALLTILSAWDTGSSAPAAPPGGKNKRPRRRGAASAGNRFTADDPNNLLYVISTEEDWINKYKPLIERLDAGLAGGAEHTVLALEHIDSDEAIQQLQTVFAGPKGATAPSYLAVPNGVLVMDATPTQLETMRGILARLDVDLLAEGMIERRIFELENAEPQEVIPVIEAVIGTSSPAGSPRKGAAAAAKSDKVRFADLGSKLWVWAPAKEMEEIEALVAELDAPGAETEIRPYEFAVGTNVTELAETLQQFFPSSGAVTRPARAAGSKRAAARRRAAAAPGGATDAEIMFVAQPESRKIFVSAPTEMFPEIEETIELLRPDVESGPKLAYEFFSIEKGDPMVIADLVEPIMNLRLEELIASGEIPETANKKASALNITADTAANRLIVAAPNVLMPEIESLIGELQDGDFGEVVVRRVKLENASAEEMAGTINAMLSGKSAPPRTTRVRGRGAKGQAGASPVVARTAEGVTVVPVPGGEALLVRGPAKDVDEVESWITMLDSEATPEKTMKVYHLLSANVEDLADEIMTVLDSAPPRGQGGKRATDDFDPFEDTWDRGGPRKGTDISLTTDYFSNTMIVWASPQKLREIDELVAVYETGEVEAGTDDPPRELVDVKYVDPYEAMMDLEEFIDALWTKDKPKVDYIPFKDTLVLKSWNAADFDRLKSILTEHIDKPGKGGESAIALKPVKGAPVDVVAELLISRLKGVDVEIDGLDQAGNGKSKWLRTLSPTDEEKLEPKELESERDQRRSSRVHPCVLPSSTLRAMEALGAMSVTQMGGGRPFGSPSAAPSKPPAQTQPADEQPEDEVVEELQPTETGGSGYVGDDAAEQILEQMLRERAARDAEKGKKSATVTDAAGQADAPTEAGSQPKAVIEAPATTETAKEEPQKLRMRVDPKTNSIYFEGSAQDVADAEYALKKIMEDLAELPALPDIRVWQLEYIDPNVAAQVLEAMFNASGGPMQQQNMARQRAQQMQLLRQRQQMQQQLQRMQQAQAQQKGGAEEEKGDKRGRREGEGEEEKDAAAQPGAQTTGVHVFPYPALRAIIIKAPTEMYPAIEELLATIDRRTDPTTDYRFFKIRNQLASNVEAQLKTIFGLDRQDQQRFQANRRMRGRGGMDPAAQAVADLMAQQLNLAGMGEEGGALSSTESITITSNDVTNTVLVRAPRQVLDLAERIIEDIEAQVPERKVMVTYELEYADATAVVPYLEELFSGGGASPRRGSRAARGGGAELTDYHPDDIDAIFIADPQTNSVIVRALENDLPTIENVIAMMDVRTGPEERVLSVVIECGDAVEMARTLETIYGMGRRNPRGAESSKKIQFVGDESSNKIFISAPQELREEVLAQVDEMDQAACKKVTPQFITLEHAEAASVAEKIEQAFGADRRGPQAGRIKVTGDDTTRRLMVIAPEETFNQIESLARALDVPPNLSGMEVKVFKLQHARAGEVFERMNDMVGKLLRQRGNQRGSLDSFSASADERSNSLVVMGGPVAFTMVQQVLDEIDVPAAAPIAVETMVISLTKANASEVARTINNLFRDRRDGIDPPHAEPNVSTNTLLVRGTRGQLEEISEKVIKPLDEFAEAPTEMLKEEVMPLQYVQAEEAAEYLRNWFNDRKRAFDALQLKGLQPAEFTVSITPEPASNQLVVMATDANLERIRERIKDIDKEGAGAVRPRDTEVYQVVYSDPNAVVGAVRSAFPTARGSAEKDRVDVAVDWATQSVIVTANEANQEAVAALVEKMDQEGGERRERKIYRLENARASEVANLVNQTISQTRSRTRTGRPPVSVVPNDSLNMLVITSTEKEYNDILPLIEQLDQKPVEDKLKVKVYPVKYADPGSLVSTINNSFPYVRGAAPEEMVRTSYTWGTSSLVVTASEENHGRVAELLAEIDVESSTERDTHVIKLQEANAEDLSRRLNDILRQTQRRRRDDTGMMVTADPGTNSLLVYANEAELKRVQELVTTLDVAQDFDKEIRSFKLTFGDVGAVREALSQLFAQRRGVRPNPREEVTVVPDWASNAVIVSASPSKMKEVASFIEQIDESGAGARDVHVVNLKYADPQGVVRSLNEIFVRQMRGRRGQETVSISNPPGTDSILIRANETEYEEIAAIIEQLDVLPDDKDRVVRRFALQHADADDIQAVIEDYMSMGGSGGRGRGRGPAGDLIGGLTINAMEGTNSLVVTGEIASVERVASLIEQLDVEVEGANTEPRIFTLEYVLPSEIEPTLNELFGGSGQGGSRRFGRRFQASSSGIETVIVANDASNSLIVRAAPSKMTEIAEFIEQIDVEGAGRGGVHVVKLKYADADSVVRSLQDIFIRGGGGRRGRSSTGQETMSISSPQGSDEILIRASDKELEEVLAVIEQLDTADTEERNARMFTLKYANASEMQTVIEDYLRKSGGSGGRRGRGRGGDELTGDVRISALESTNSLVVTGDEEGLERVAQLIEDIDVEVESGIEPHIIPLEKATASVIEPMLTEMFVESQRGRGRGRDTTAIQPTILANDASNSLIVRASPSDYNAIEKLVKALDSEEADPGKRIKLVQMASSFNVEDLAPTILETVRQAVPPETGGRRSARGGRGEGISVEPIRASNSLLIAGEPRQLELAMAVVDQILEVGPLGDMETVIIKTNRISPEQVQQLIQDMTQDRQGGSRSSGRSSGVRGRRTPRRR